MTNSVAIVGQLNNITLHNIYIERVWDKKNTLASMNTGHVLKKF